MLAVLQPTKLHSTTTKIIVPVYYYVIISNDETKLTFTSFSWEKPEDEHTFKIKESYSSAPEWCSSKIKEVEFESGQYPRNTAYWFYGCSNLTKIDGIEKLIVNRVQNMDYMFYGCSSLSSLDLSSFDTPNVTSVSYMFSGCSRLSSLDLSNFDTSYVIDMDNMFSGCRSLTTLDLSSFNTNKLKSCMNMFASCSNLRTIYANHWDILANLTDEERAKFLIYHSRQNYSNYMFNGCTSLVGGNGTVYNSSLKNDYKYAHIDGGSSSPGYFTLKPSATRPYAVLNDSTLTLYYDDQIHARIGYKYPIQSDSSPGWRNNYNVKIAIVDASFSQYASIKANWFSYCNYLNRIEGLENLNFDNTTDLSEMFYDCCALKTIDLSRLKTKSITNMNSMFYNCCSLKTIDLSGLNTTSVTNMGSMFYHCFSLEDVQLSGLDTRNVTNMSGMFGSCMNLKELDLKSFNTSKVTDMSYMFSGCLSLKTVNVKNFQTEAVTDMGSMFSDCVSLTDIDVNSFNTKNVKSMAFMFSGCYSLTSLDLKNFNTENVSDMQYMFGNYLSSGVVVISPEPTWYRYYTRIKETLSLPENKSLLKSLDITSFITSNVTNMKGMFGYCESLTCLELRNFDTQNVTNMSYMFNGCVSLQTLNICTFNTDNVTDMSYLFSDCAKLSTLDISGFNTANVTNMSKLFYGCKNLQELYLSGFNTKKTTNMGYMFNGCESLKSIFVQDLWDVSNVSYDVKMFEGCVSLQGDKGTKYNAEKTDGTYAHLDGGTNKPGYLSNVIPSVEYTGKQPYAVFYNNTLTFYYDEQINNRAGIKYAIKPKYSENYQPKWVLDYRRQYIQKAVFDSSFSSYRPTSTAFWFYQCNKLRSIERFENLNTSQVTTMAEMFRYCSVLNNLDLRSLDTSNVTDMSCMFCYCWGLNNLNVSNFNTAKVHSMTHMFHQCPISSIDVSNFNTENVVDMSIMFMECKHLNNIDLKSFNTMNLNNASLMFANNPSLTTISVSDLWTVENVTDGNNMFQGSTRIVGGMGTRYDENHIDHEYAQIDGGMCDPGYFSGEKQNGEGEAYAVLDTLGTLTFYYDRNKNCRGGDVFIVSDESGIWTDVENLEVRKKVKKSVFDATYANYHPISARFIFNRCENMVSIEAISNLQTESIVDMWGMFNGCYSLTQIDLSHFNTSNVKYMTYMFSVCRSLTSLDLHSFDTRNVENMNMMFHLSDAIKSLDLSNFDTSKLTSIVQMFDGCYQLSELNISSFNTANVKNMDRMFENCRSLKKLDLRNFDTGQVESMIDMFSFCSALEELDLSSFNTEKLQHIHMIFYNCRNLKTIYVSKFWNTKYMTELTNNSFAFKDCYSLVGGAGTTYDSDHTDYTYAHIDGGLDNPGYFTYKQHMFVGDVNDDGSINVTDVIGIVNYIIGNPLNNFNENAADINKDGTVNISDAVNLINIILSK